MKEQNIGNTCLQKPEGTSAPGIQKTKFQTKHNPVLVISSMRCTTGITISPRLEFRRCCCCVRFSMIPRLCVCRLRCSCCCSCAAAGRCCMQLLRAARNCTLLRCCGLMLLRCCGPLLYAAAAGCLRLRAAALLRGNPGNSRRCWQNYQKTMHCPAERALQHPGERDASANNR